jgi:hypothetical protein
VRIFATFFTDAVWNKIIKWRRAGLGVHVQLGSSHYSDLYISAVSPPASPALRSEGLCQLLTFKLPDWLQLQDRVTYHIKSVLILWNCIITQI